MICFFVMAGHSRPKDGVASACLCPAIQIFLPCIIQDADARDNILEDALRAFDPERRAEPVIGPRMARTRWRFRAGMTTGGHLTLAKRGLRRAASPTAKVQG